MTEVVTNDELMEAARTLHDKLKPEIDSRGMDESYYDWIIPTYESFKQPHPDDFDPLASALRNVATAFIGVSDENKGDAPTREEGDFLYIESAAKTIEKWDGHLGDAIKDNYLRPFPDIMTRQGNMAMFLLDRIVTLGHIYGRRRKDALKIAEDGISAIESWDESCSGSALEILMAATISASTIFTGIGGIAGGMAAKAATAFGSAGIVGGTLGDALGEGDDVPLGADRIQDIATNIKDTLDKSEEQMSEEEDNVLKDLKEAEAELWELLGTDNEKNNKLRPATPKGSDSANTVKDNDLVIYK